MNNDVNYFEKLHKIIFNIIDNYKIIYRILISIIILFFLFVIISGIYVETGMSVLSPYIFLIIWIISFISSIVIIALLKHYFNLKHYWKLILSSLVSMSTIITFFLCDDIHTDSLDSPNKISIMLQHYFTSIGILGIIIGILIDLILHSLKRFSQYTLSLNIAENKSTESRFNLFILSFIIISCSLFVMFLILGNYSIYNLVNNPSSNYYLSKFTEIYIYYLLLWMIIGIILLGFINFYYLKYDEHINFIKIIKIWITPIISWITAFGVELTALSSLSLKVHLIDYIVSYFFYITVPISILCTVVIEGYSFVNDIEINICKFHSKRYNDLYYVTRYIINNINRISIQPNRPTISYLMRHRIDINRLKYKVKKLFHYSKEMFALKKMGHKYSRNYRDAYTYAYLLMYHKRYLYIKYIIINNHIILVSFHISRQLGYDNRYVPIKLN